jgi:GMC oxidoreductase
MIELSEDYVARKGPLLEANICIVGAGAAGIAMARRLVNQGKKGILLLESSAHDEPGPVSNEHLEVLRRFGTYPPEAGMDREHRWEDKIAQPLYQGKESSALESIDPKFLSESRIKAYGGTTNCWGGWTRPLGAIDLDRTDLGPDNAWPIDRNALNYDLAMEYCSLPAEVGVERYDEPAFWKDKTYVKIDFMPVDTLPSAQLKNVMFLLMNQSRWDFQSVYGPELEGAKEEECLVLRNSNVRVVEPSARGNSVDHLYVSAIQGGTKGLDFKVKANAYVLATGGTEVARLLLHSAPGGLGNASGFLGRTFMVHVLNTEIASFGGGRTPVSDDIFHLYSEQSEVNIGEHRPDLFCALAPTDATLRSEGMRNFRAIIRFDSKDPPLGKIDLNWEQTPNRESRVTLDGGKDSLFGDPLPLLDWRTTAEDAARNPRQAIDMVAAALSQLGYLQTLQVKEPLINWPGDHHMGATRMSARAEDGYVNADCRAHEVDNLYIAGSSVFPTVGYANPTLTIVGLALRLADHLARTTN